MKLFETSAAIGFSAVAVNLGRMIDLAGAGDSASRAGYGGICLREVGAQHQCSLESVLEVISARGMC